MRAEQPPLRGRARGKLAWNKRGCYPGQNILNSNNVARHSSKRVPTVLWMKAFGISAASTAIAGKPVQCVGTTTAGAYAASALLVCLVTSETGPGRWKPPITA